MSYILDALRRANADRERERGAVPSIHAAPTALGSAALDPEDDEGRSRWPLLAGAALLVAGGAAAWFAGFRGGETTPAVAPVPAPLPVTPAASAQAPAASSVPAAPLPAAAAPAPVPGVPPATVPAPAPGRSAVTPPPAEARSKPRPPAPATTHSPAPAPAPAAARTAPVPASGGADGKPPAPRVYAVSELPEDVRRSLPVLSIGGSIYAESPRDRLLILGGRLFREGDQPAPELTIERIKPKAAEFSFRGYRYEVPF